MIDSNDSQKSNIHISAYLGLCIVAWFIGAIVANSISILIGNFYAESTFPTLIGFWLGKLVSKNKNRGWGEVMAFPVIIFIVAFIGPALGSALMHQNIGNMNFAALISTAISFLISCGLFFILKVRK